MQFLSRQNENADIDLYTCLYKLVILLPNYVFDFLEQIYSCGKCLLLLLLLLLQQTAKTFQAIKGEEILVIHSYFST